MRLGDEVSTLPQSLMVMKQSVLWYTEDRVLHRDNDFMNPGGMKNAEFFPDFTVRIVVSKYFVMSGPEGLPRIISQRHRV